MVAVLAPAQPCAPRPFTPSVAPAASRAIGPSGHRLPASTYRRRRVVAAVLAVGAVLVLWVALGLLGGGPLFAPERPGATSAGLGPGEVYVVQPGDTFWSIAVRLRPQADPRPLVDRMVAAHGGTTLHVGERLRLP